MDGVDAEVLKWIVLARRLRAVNEDRFQELLAALEDVVDAEESIAGVCRSCGSRHKNACA